MLTIKELTVKNFMSVGNQAQAIDFSNKSLVLVIGENMDLGGDDAGARNGTGKTTIINALSYVFFGCLLYTSPSPRDRQKSRMPSSA